MSDKSFDEATKTLYDRMRADPSFTMEDHIKELEEALQEEKP